MVLRCSSPPLVDGGLPEGQARLRRAPETRVGPALVRARSLQQGKNLNLPSE